MSIETLKLYQDLTKDPNLTIDKLDEALTVSPNLTKELDDWLSDADFAWIQRIRMEGRFPVVEGKFFSNQEAVIKSIEITEKKPNPVEINQGDEYYREEGVGWFAKIRAPYKYPDNKDPFTLPSDRTD